MDKYFVIRNGEGDTTVTEFTKERLLKALEENYWGLGVVALNAIKERDTNYWGESILIIKGSIVTPTAKEQIVKYDI